MIDISDDAIVAERLTSGGRFALFCNTDLPAGYLLPWWSVMLDHGGDAAATLVRLDEAHGQPGWTLLALTELAAARARAEATVVRSPLTQEAVGHLDRAAGLERDRRAGLPPAGELVFDPLEAGAGWPWLAAEFADEGCIEFCPGLTGSSDEGVTLELLLQVVVQVVEDASRLLPEVGAFGGIGLCLDRALAAVARRDSYLRSRR